MTVDVQIEARRAMLNRIAKYLKEAGRPLAAEDIVRAVLKIRSPRAAAQKVLQGILAGDSRFRCADEKWSLAETAGTEAPEITGLAALFLESAPTPGGGLSFRGAVHLPDTGATVEFVVPPSADSANRQALEQARRHCEGRHLLVWRRSDAGAWLGCLRRCALSEWSGRQTSLSLLAEATEIGCLAWKSVRRMRPEDIAAGIGLAAPDAENPGAMARYLSAVFNGLLNWVPPDHRRDMPSLNTWIENRQPSVDFGRFAFGPDLLAQLPEKPGVYIMRNRSGRMIYVGKSRNLKRRVSSYFHPRALAKEKIAGIHQELYTIETCVTGSEVEALLMETRLIRDFRPPVNLQAEIHETERPYGKGRNILLLVPDMDANRAELYFLREGVFAARQSIPLGRSPSARICARIASVYFTPGRKRSRRQVWEVEIVSRWLAANRRRINFIDVDDLGSPEAVQACLADYLKDPEKLRNKVVYRR
jgi:hypothetical protein